MEKKKKIHKRGSKRELPFGKQNMYLVLFADLLQLLYICLTIHMICSFLVINEVGVIQEFFFVFIIYIHRNLNITITITIGELGEDLFLSSFFSWIFFVFLFLLYVFLFLLFYIFFLIYIYIFFYAVRLITLELLVCTCCTWRDREGAPPSFLCFIYIYIFIYLYFYWKQVVSE